MAHEITANIIHAHGEQFERVVLVCSCGVSIPSYRRTISDQSELDAAGFPLNTSQQLDAIRAQAVQGHARAGILIR